MMKAKGCYLRKFAVSTLFTAHVVAALALAPVCAGAQARGPAAASGSESTDSGIRFTYDLSASTGSTGSSNYTEIAIGLNSYFADWFVWRNAGFSRMGTGYDGTYGLDTSARFQFDLGDQTLGLHTFAGPGYRFVVTQNQDTGVSNRTDSAPFVEAGAVLSLGGLRIGAGLKTILNNVLDNTKQDETQYFLILSGGGRL